MEASSPAQPRFIVTSKTQVQYNPQAAITLIHIILRHTQCLSKQSLDLDHFSIFLKGHPPSADLRYGEEDSISHSTLIFAEIKG